MIAKQDRLAGITQLGDQEPEDESVLLAICEQLRAARLPHTVRYFERQQRSEYYKRAIRPVEPETEADL